MTYKAEYRPSQLLCPVSLKWVDFEIGKKRLEEHSPVRNCCALHVSPTASQVDEKSRFKMEDILLDIGENRPHIVKVGMLNKAGKDFVVPHITEMLEEVGADLCENFIVKLR